QGRPVKTKAKKQAPGRRRPYAQLRVIKAPRVQLATEFAGVSEKPTSCRKRQKIPKSKSRRHPFHSTGSAQGRRQTRNDEFSRGNLDTARFRR
ncbi:MAG: hypothetical protein ABSF67_18245, partial [Roseiarcus sp.]